MEYNLVHKGFTEVVLRIITYADMLLFIVTPFFSVVRLISIVYRAA